MRNLISALLGTAVLGTAGIQSLSMATILGLGMVTVSPALMSTAAHSGTAVLPGWRRPCRLCMYTWRGGAPFRRGGYNPAYIKKLR
jgi:hypothetical protein